MLLTIQDLSGHISSDVIWDIIAKDERNSLSLLQVDMAHHSFSKHSWFLLLLEAHCRAGHSIFFAMINCDIKLQLYIFRGESDCLAFEASWVMV